jgi:chromosome segregation ATPase
LLTF